MVQPGARRALGIWALVLFASCGGRSKHSGVEDASAGGGSSSFGGNGAGANPSSAGAGRGSAPGNAGTGASLAGNSSAGGGVSAGSPSAGGGQTGGVASQGGVSPAGGSSGVSGNVGTAGGPPAAVVAKCTTLCEQLESCGDGGGLGPDCQLDCERTVMARKGECSDLGLKMSSCLEGARGFNSDCTQSFFRTAQAQCFEQVTAYQKCVAGGAGVELPPLLCARISGGSSDSCVEDRKCLNSTWYNLKCVATGDGQSDCTCTVHGDFVADFTLAETVSEPTVDACKKRIAACLAATAPSP